MKLLVAATSALLAARTLTPVDLKAGGAVGFDDMLWSPALHAVLVPAGRTGRLEIIGSTSDSIGGFSTAKPGSEHGAGTTSADYGHGLIFASDRNLGVVDVVDPKTKKIVSSAKLAAGPDYVRWVEPRGEVWVTEPRGKSIEIFTLDGTKLSRTASITLPDGPESLVIDATRGRAYTHSWTEKTFAIDLATRKVAATWSNGCKGARGIALDEPHGILFAGCDEGRAVAMDVAHDGKKLGEATTAKGVDIIAFAPGIRHLYAPGGDDAALTVMSVTTAGVISVLGTLPAAADSHCVAADDARHAWVCDPGNGRLLRLDDDF